MMGTIICRHDRLRRQCDECDMSEEIAQLRAENEQLRAENARLWEAMPSEDDRDALHECIDAVRDLGVVGDRVHVAARAVNRLARLDAAKEGR